MTGTSETLTASAVEWFEAMAQEAERDLNALPESSQPFWFRTRKVGS